LQGNEVIQAERRVREVEKEKEKIKERMQAEIRELREKLNQ
jgi:predicted phage gp36 major capsid-like protein